jgi:DNA invertase Pin-like site-specific DNA recombinase
MSDARVAVLYARVSDKDKQDTRQMLAILRTYAQGRGWAIAGEHSDKVTGDPARRQGEPPGLRAAMERVASLAGAGVLVISAADRLVRSPIELLDLVARVQALPGAVCSAEDGNDCDTSTDTGQLLLFIRGWLARMELKFIRKRTMAVLGERRERCKREGGFVSKRGIWRSRLGRPSPPAAKLFTAYELWKGGAGTREVASRTGLNDSTLRTYFRRWERGEAIPRETPNGEVTS